MGVRFMLGLKSLTSTFVTFQTGMQSYSPDLYSHLLAVLQCFIVTRQGRDSSKHMRHPVCGTSFADYSYLHCYFTNATYIIHFVYGPTECLDSPTFFSFRNIMSDKSLACYKIPIVWYIM